MKHLVAAASDQAYTVHVLHVRTSQYCCYNSTCTSYVALAAALSTYVYGQV